MIDQIFPHNRFTLFNDSLVKSFPDEIHNLIEKHKTIISLKKGQTLYHEASIPNGVYIIKKGKVKKYITGLNGKEHIFYLVKENGIIGHHTVLNKETHSHSVSCLTDCTFYLIPKKIFALILKKNRNILNRLLKSFSHEFDVFIINSKILAQHSVRERTAISILKLERFFNENSSFTLSRKDHSNLIGTSVESLIRVLSDFKKEKAIEIDGHSIIIKDSYKLAKATNII